MNRCIAVLCAIASSMLFQTVEAQEDRGRMTDRSATLEVASGENTEFNTSLDGLAGPSSVKLRDREAMRRSAATLPDAAPSRVVEFSDAADGALFASGSDELTPAWKALLDRVAAFLADKRKLRFSIVGHADAQPLSARTRSEFGDNQGLSEARAFQVAEHLRVALNLPVEAFTIRGEGDRRPAASNDTPDGMARNRRVELELWYDEVEQRAAVAAAAASPPVDACADYRAAPATPLRITIDGEPVGAGDGVTEADRQRCVDVAVNRHDFRIQFDALDAEPALNVSAWPNPVPAGEAVELVTYSNYVHWIRKAEIRFFAPGQDPREQPFLILPIEIGAAVRLTPDERMPPDSFHVLRVYGEDGRFDETVMKPLRIVDRTRPIGDEEPDARERLTGYGESSLRIRNIPISGGTVTVSGRDVLPDQTVTAFGRAAPVDPDGRFATRQLLPAGTHTVVVEIAGPGNEHTTFSRNINIESRDWFHVALGEVTVADNNTTGPAQLVTQDVDRYEDDTEITGRGAMYIKGKFREDYLVTLSADTRERPLEDLFSNFTSKDPRYLLERIDPEQSYAVYGDDSSSVWDAPTNGRFYASVEKHESRALWGNFQTAWSGLELNQFSRGLYGAGVLLKSEATTSHGERRLTQEVFAAEPGTLSSREEFRGTGGSLYYLKRQDITRGSERLWIEVRDQTSGVTLQRTQLVPGLDYELSYLQGRILLRAPLSSVAGSSTLVQTGSLSGNPLFVVATYEYAPGLNEVDSNVYGLRNSTWINDRFRIGVSGYRQGEDLDRQTVGGIDATLRLRPATYLDLEAAQSDGIGSLLSSIDGGFGFNQSTTTDARADARRVQGVFDLAEWWEGGRGRGSVYWQDRDRGFSGPGAITAGEAVEQKGAAFGVPVGERTSITLRVDERDARVQRVSAEEASVHHQLGDRWAVSVGARHDDRQNDVPNASPTLSQNGERTDAILRFDYKPLRDDSAPESELAAAATPAAPVSMTPFQPRSQTYDPTRSNVLSRAADDVAARAAPWQGYTYMQGTVDRSGDRAENDRAGVGAEKQINDRWRLGGEVSGGSGGGGGLLSGDYRTSDRANVYLTHSIETERPDWSERGRFGNTVLGTRVKLSDQVSVYDEARAARGIGPQSLTNAFGVDLAPNDRWTYGLKLEAGTVSDPLAGDLERRAAALSTAYQIERLKLSSTLEYRREDGTGRERDTWLGRNTLGFQATSDWRLLGKLNFSSSDASLGNFYDGDFVDAAFGGAYRPIGNDRWNALLQYRYYYTLPSPGQVGLSDELLDYAQRSNVVSLDAVYDVTARLSLGAKYGQRSGELRNSREDGEWYSSRADLIVLRADLHIVRAWDFTIELRRLAVDEADDEREGALAALYRHIGKHLKLGVGYNFTDFSDDLTDLSYRSEGPFINVVSKF
jgi:outer membrane protein OmpA-like peptidoglycan-associated protein